MRDDVQWDAVQYLINTEWDGMRRRGLGEIDGMGWVW